jgi:uncharacterized protein DUF6581
VLRNLSDLWEISQPPHLRHLTIIRDTDSSSRTPQYLYRTFDNFQEAVELGETAWDAVGEPGVEQRQEKAKVDKWGFPVVPSIQFLDTTKPATIKECALASKDPPVTLTSLDPVLVRSSNGETRLQWRRVTGSNGKSVINITKLRKLSTTAGANTRQTDTASQRNTSGRGPNVIAGMAQREYHRRYRLLQKIKTESKSRRPQLKRYATWLATQEKIEEFNQKFNNGQWRELVDTDPPADHNTNLQTVTKETPLRNGKRKRQSDPNSTPGMVTRKRARLECSSTRASQEHDEYIDHTSSSKPSSRASALATSQNRIRPQVGLKRPIIPSEARVSELIDEFETCSTEGVHVSPPGSSYYLPGMNEPTGRKVLVVMFKFEWLQKLDWFRTEGLSKPLAQDSTLTNEIQVIPGSPSSIESTSIISPAVQNASDFRKRGAQVYRVRKKGRPRKDEPRRLVLNFVLPQLLDPNFLSINPNTPGSFQPDLNINTALEVTAARNEAHQSQDLNDSPYMPTLPSRPNVAQANRITDGMRASQKRRRSLLYSSADLNDIMTLIRKNKKAKVQNSNRDETAQNLPQPINHLGENELEMETNVPLEVTPVQDANAPKSTEGVQPVQTPHTSPVETNATTPLTVSTNLNTPTRSNLNIFTPTPKPKGRSKRKTSTVPTQAVTVGLGGSRFRRSNLILDIVNKCGGMFPGDGELLLPFQSMEKKLRGTAQADRNTVMKAVKNLLDQGKLIKIAYLFNTSKGNSVTKHVLLVPQMSFDDPKVQKLIEECKISYPRNYLPPEVEERAPQDPKLSRPGTSRYFRNDESVLVVSNSPQNARAMLDSQPWAVAFYEKQRQLAEARQNLFEQNRNGSGRVVVQMNRPFPLLALKNSHKSKEQNNQASSLKKTSSTTRKPTLNGSEQVQTSMSPEPAYFRAWGMRLFYKAQARHQHRILAPQITFQPKSGTFGTDFRLRRAAKTKKVDAGTVDHRPEHRERTTISAESGPDEDSDTLNQELQKWTKTGHDMRMVGDGPSSGFVTYTIGHPHVSLPVVRLEPRGRKPQQQRQLPKAPRLLKAPKQQRQPESQARENASPATESERQNIVNGRPATSLIPSIFPPIQPSRYLPSGITLAKLTEGFLRKDASRTTANASPSTATTTTNATLAADVVPKTSSRAQRTPARTRLVVSAIDYVTKQKASPWTKLNPTCIITPRAGKKLLYAAVITRTLAGGVSQNVPWSIIDSIYLAEEYPHYAQQNFKRRWEWMIKNHGDIIQLLQDRFERSFLKSYENGELPVFNPADMESYDWQSVIDWAQNKIEVFGSNTLLSASNETLAADYGIDLSSRPGQKTLGTSYRSVHTNYRRSCVVHSMDFTAPLMESSNTIPEEIDVARSWARAALTNAQHVTGDAIANAKLRTLDDNVLRQAIDQLLEERSITRTTGSSRDPVAAQYELQDKVDLYLASKPLKSKAFDDAIALKKQLDFVFRQEKAKFVLAQDAPDGHIIAITELVASGRLKVNPILPPVDSTIGAPGVRLSVWGMNEGSYEAKKVDKRVYMWNLEAENTEKFVFGLPLQAVIERTPIPLKHPDDSTDRARIPFWVNIHGIFLRQRWRSCLVAVLGLLSFDAGITVPVMWDLLKQFLAIWEIEMVVTWLKEVGVVENCDGTDLNGGLRVTEWWWTAIPPE